MSIIIRQLAAADLSSVMQIQAACYPAHYLEAEAVFADRIANCATTSWLALEGERALGYLFSYPSQSGKICALGSAFAPQLQANCLYLHDMAVLPETHGRGIARALHQAALAYAGQQGMHSSALVAVLNAASFWQKLGYQAGYALAPEQVANLRSYGEQACYLLKYLQTD